MEWLRVGQDRPDIHRTVEVRKIAPCPAESGRRCAIRRAGNRKTGEELVFTKADSTAWGKNQHVRPLLEACKNAKIRPAVAFHELRHTYASHLAQAGVDLLTISKLLGQPLNAAKRAIDGKETHFLAQEFQDLKGFIPGGNIWYAKAAIDHLVWQQVMESLSPGYLSSIRQRTLRDYQQQWWWEPGETTPERAPDLRAAIKG